MKKVFLPALVFAAVQGVGVYVAQLAFYGNHKAHGIAAGIVAVAAGIAFSWTAFKVGLFKGLFRPRVTSITIVALDPSTPNPTNRCDGNQSY
jgi:hypothetical protein